MTVSDDLLALEREGWEALSTSGEAATAFYDRVLDDEVQMLLPGGMAIADRAQVVESMGGAPWNRYELRDERVLELGGDAAVVTYRASAERDGTEYEALFASTYRRAAGGWRLAVHQQTPV